MPTDLKALEARALDLMKRSDFGPDAVRINSEILAQAPANAPAWTRLGRCYMELREFDEAVAAFRSALALNPSNGVATNLLNEVRKRRAMTPTAAARATTGFTAREFTILETLPADRSSRTLQPRMEALFDAINATSTAAKIVETRRREREPGTKLFHANSFHSHASGHIYAFHQGGRWEPQFNLGWLSNPPFPANCVRIVSGSASRLNEGGPRVAPVPSARLPTSPAFNRSSTVRGRANWRSGWRTTAVLSNTAATRQPPIYWPRGPSSGW